MSKEQRLMSPKEQMILSRIDQLLEKKSGYVSEGCAYKFIGTQQPYERHCEPVNSIWH